MFRSFMILALIGSMSLPALAAEGKPEAIEYQVIVITTPHLDGEGKKKRDEMKAQSQTLLEGTINREAQEGWRFTGATAVAFTNDLNGATHYLYFERAKK